MPEAWIDGRGAAGLPPSLSTGKIVVTPPDVTLTYNDADSLECLQAEGFTWTDNDCNLQQHFICEKKIGNHLRSTVLIILLHISHPWNHTEEAHVHKSVISLGFFLYNFLHVPDNL